MKEGRDRLQGFWLHGHPIASDEVIEARLFRKLGSRPMLALLGSCRVPLEWMARSPYEELIWPHVPAPNNELVIEVSRPIVGATFLINGSVLRIVQR